MATRTIATRIALEGEQEFKRQMSAVNSELKTLGTEMQYVEARFKGQENSVEALTEKQRIYQAQITQQQEKIKALAQAVVDATEVYGEGSVEVDRYKQQLNRARTELTKTYNAERDVAAALEKVQQEGKQAADAIEDVGDASKDADGPTGDLAGELVKLKGAVVGGAIAAGAKEVADAILDIVDSTKEYRTTMGMLETSGEAAGYSANQTREAYLELYKVMGDSQAAAETAQNVQALNLEQQKQLDLINLIIGATIERKGVTAEQLSENILETIKAGQATGAFADVLNMGAKEGETYGIKLRDANEANEEWNTKVSEAKTAEDYFNLALEETADWAGRVDLVMQALADQGLNDIAEAWRQNNEDIVKLNESEDRWEQAMGRLGEFLSPAADAIRNFGAGSVNWLVDRFEDLIDVVSDAWDALASGSLEYEINQKRAASRGYDVEAWKVNKSVEDTKQSMTQILGTTETAVRQSLQLELPSTQQDTVPAYMKQVADAAANAAVAQAPKGGDIVINLSNEVGGTTVARHQYRFNQAEAERRGQSMY